MMPRADLGTSPTNMRMASSTLSRQRAERSPAGPHSLQTIAHDRELELTAGMALNILSQSTASAQDP